MSKLNKNVVEKLAITQAMNNALDTIALTYSKKYRKIVRATYESDEIHALYRGMRKASSLNKEKNRDKQLLIKIPNAYVLHFLNDMFEPKYGPKWLEDKKTLLKIMRNEDLIKPWITVHKF